MTKDRLVNLYDIIQETLTIYGKTEEDIDYVSMMYNGENIYMSWEDFKVKAKNFNFFLFYEYDIVNPTIKIVGKGCWWLEIDEDMPDLTFVLKSKPEKGTYMVAPTLRAVI